MPTLSDCFKDSQKKIFLVEVHDGVTSKGIVIGESTMKDVVLYMVKRAAVAPTSLNTPEFNSILDLVRKMN